MLGVRSRDAPVVLRVRSSQRDTEGLVRARSNNRIFKVVHEPVVLLAEVEPRMTVLVHKQRVGRRDVRVVLEAHHWPLPCIPTRGINRMCWRPKREQVHHHQFAVVIPPPALKSSVAPRHGEHIPAVEHPGPINAMIKIGRKLINLMIVAEVLSRREHATEQQRCVDGRGLAPMKRSSALYIIEVRKEAVVVLQLVMMKPQGVTHARQNSLMRNVTSPISDAQRREPEASRCNRRHTTAVANSRRIEGLRSIQHLPSIWTCLL